MATDRMALLEQLGKAAAGGDVDFLRSAVKTMAEALMELEVAAKLGADPHERTPDRLGYRNGHRSRDWDTRGGTIQLDIPRAREGGRIVSMAFLVAIAVNERGEREVLGCDVGSAETGALWTGFLRSLVGRGLAGVVLVTSDAHVGLREAIAATLLGATWQRCRVHVLRDVLAHVPKTAQAMVAAFSRTVFAQPDPASAHAQLGQVVERLAPSFPKAAATLLAAETDLLAYLAVPHQHWSKVWSTNPIERLNRELARRNDVVGIFPNRESLIRLGGALLAEQHDEWLTDGRRYLPQASMNRLLGGGSSPTLGDLLKEGIAV